MSKDSTSVTRRDFVKSGALSAATVTAFSVLRSPEARAAAPIRVGVIGLGGRGKGAMEDSIRSYEGTKIVALADLFPRKIGQAKERLAKFDQKVADDHCLSGWDAYKQLLKLDDIDYVILATPPVFRPLMLEAVIEAGKHCFMEKPAAVDAPGIRKIIAAGEKAKEKGLNIVAGTQRRHQAEYVETIKRIHDGAIGDLTALYVYWCGGPIGFSEKTGDITEMEYQIRNWYHYLWLSGDHIIEQHVHNIDVGLWTMGPGSHPVKAAAIGGRSWQERGNIWDHHAVDFEFENGVRMSSYCEQQPGSFSRVSELAHGTKGRSNCANWITAGGKDWKFDKDALNPYIQEHADLIAHITSGEYINESRNVAYSTMTAIMGRMAGYGAREVTWDEAYNSNETVGLHENYADYKLGPVPERAVQIPGGKPYDKNEGWIPDPGS
ncbi:MAG: gfo/Idh/MocA family oxidoreductase [bacterium]|nr:gfo/Idh/MocA family oxidoreductase [bacterium]